MALTPRELVARLAGMLCCSLAVVIAAGCGHKKQPRPSPTATAPPVYTPPSPPRLRRPSRRAAGRFPITPVPEGGISAEDKEFILSHRPDLQRRGSGYLVHGSHEGERRRTDRCSAMMR